MSVKRDPRTDHWFFRTRVTYPDGKRCRIFGTPGVSGLYHDLPNSKQGALEAERRAIANAMTGQQVRIVTAKEVPTIRAYVEPFMDGYAVADKPGSRKDKRQRLNAYILPAVGDRRLNELLQEHVDKIVHDMLEDEASRKQINNTLSVLSSLIGYAVTNKVIADPEIKFWIKSTSETMDAVALDDVAKLADKATTRYRAAVLLAADAGLRIGEIRALPWIEINELQRELKVTASYDRSGNLTAPKSWEQRTLPISERLWDAIQAVPRVGPLIVSRRDGKPLSYDAMAQVIHELYEDAGVTKPMKPWHSLRHTFGTELGAKTSDIETIRDLMGHKSIETTQRYLHTTRDRKRAAIALLAPSGSHRAAAPKSSTK